MPGYVDTDLSVNMSWPGRSHLVFGGRDSATPARVQAVQEAGGHAVLCAERSGWVDPGSLVEHLAASGVRTVMLEGGPTLAHSFLGSDLVDRWVSFVAPLALGEGPTWPQSSPDIEPVGPSARAGTGRFHLTRCERAGGDAMLVLDRLAFDEALRRLTEMPEA